MIWSMLQFFKKLFVTEILLVYIRKDIGRKGWREVWKTHHCHNLYKIKLEVMQGCLLYKNYENNCYLNILIYLMVGNNSDNGPQN